MPPSQSRPHTPHDHALERAGNVLMWSIDTGPGHPDATFEGAAEQIVAMYLREIRDVDGDPRTVHAARRLLDAFPEKRR